MQLLATASFGILIGASLLVGARLLLLYRRTGGLPELLLGAMLLLVTGIGYPLHVVADRVGSEWLSPVMIVASVSVGVGNALLFVFTWQVFRPRETWARVLAGAGVTIVLGMTVYDCVRVYGGRIELSELSQADILLKTAPMFAVWAWTAWESLRYYPMMRRRVKLGLADVAVSNRFLLWGLMSTSASVGVLANVVAVLLGVDTYHSPGILLFSSLSGAAQAGLMVLALVPPRSYLSWVRARAATSEES